MPSFRKPISTLNFSHLPVNRAQVTLNSGNISLSDERYIAKGGDGSSCIEYLDDSNDVINITNHENSSYQVNRNILRARLEELKVHSSVMVSQLDIDSRNLFDSVVEAMKALYDNPPVYNLVVSDIRSVFTTSNNVQNIKPGTVLAYFTGCFSDTSFPGPIGCSPRCVSSLQPTDGTPGYEHCDDPVLVYTDSHFNPMNDKHSDHAFIYIADPNFKSFTSDNISQLRNAGIKDVTLVYTNADGSYREISPSPIAVDDLSTSSSTSTSTNTGIIIAVIIVILIILALLVVYRPF